MSRRSFFVKDPDEVLDYGWDWGTERLGDGELVTDSSFAVTPPGLILGDTASDGQVTTLWVSAGTRGIDYRVTNHVVTSEGRAYDWTIIIRVRDR